MTKVYGLIGYPLGHSFSKQYFEKKFKENNILDCDYQLFPITSISEITNFINETTNLKGFNVTIPYKEQILPYLNDIDLVAKNISSVNVVKVIKNNNNFKLIGYNSDAYGFEKTLENYLNFLKNSTALILGTGGSSKAVSYILNKHNIKHYFVSRSKKTENIINYNDINKKISSDISLIINCTPLGMYPKIDDCPNINFSLFNKNTIFYDLIYNPSETKFLKMAKENNCTTINGLQMLINQADKAWEIWNEL